MNWKTIIYENTESESESEYKYNAPLHGLSVIKNSVTGKYCYQILSSNSFKTRFEIRENKQPNFPAIKDNIIKLISVPKQINRYTLFNRISDTQCMAIFDLSNATRKNRYWFCISNCGKYSLQTNIENETGNDKACYVYCLTIRQI